MEQDRPTPTVCERCNSPLAQGALVCGACHALVHSEELKHLTADAQALEQSGDLTHAREHWQASLALLPADAEQHLWIRNRIASIDREIADAGGEVKPKHPWAEKLGPLAPIAILLAKGKGLLALFKFQTVFSLFWFLWLYTKLYGVAFGVGFVVQIFIHEMGHYIDIRRRGLPVDMPVFLPGLGAYVRWRALGVSKETRAEVSLAGPLAGLLAAAFCFAVWYQTQDPLWAALAHAGAWLNLLNLIPVWVLDGGSAMFALGRAQRIAVLVVTLLLWYATGETLFLLVGAGCVWRLFTRDLPQEPGTKATAYFIALLFALGLLLHYIPKQNSSFGF